MELIRYSAPYPGLYRDDATRSMDKNSKNRQNPIRRWTGFYSMHRVICRMN